MPPVWPRLDEVDAEDKGYEEDGMTDELRAPPEAYDDEPPSEYSATMAASPPLRSPWDEP